MKDISSLLFDPELGSVSFTVERAVYKHDRAENTLISRSTTPVIGVIHPVAPEEIQPKPAEDVHEEYIAVYTNYTLSAGESFGRSFTAPDRIHWNGKTFRVVKARSLPQFYYCQALAVRLREEELSG